MTKKLKITIAICVAVVLVAALTIGLGVGLTVNRGDGHTHTWAAEWTSDKDGHWHECTGENCGETNGYAAHSDGNSDGKCDVCGYTMTTETPDPEDPIVVTGITIDKTIATVEEGATVTLTATVTPGNATDKTVTWSTSNEAIATVSGGVVTGVKAGEVTITAKAGDKSATCTVTVTAKQGTEDPEDPIAVEGITLDKTTATVEEGATVTLTATVTPDNATDKTVTWSTSNETIATVSGGVVTGVKAGEVTITAKAGDKSATCTVTVTAAATEPDPPVHEHTWSTEWTTDADSHWHECTGEGCDEVKDKAAHSDGNSDGKCDTCGYTMTTETPDPGQEATSQEYPFDYAELNQKAPDNKDGDHKTTTEITVGKYTLEAGIYHDGSTYINSQGKSIKVVLGGDYNSISLSAVSASSNKEVAITILNAEGVAVFERTVLSKTQQTISADNLPAGTYTIQTENSARIYNLKATEYYLPCACENLTQVAEYKAPTCTEAGNIAYWRCDDCGKLYSDAEGKTEITEADIAIPAKGHSPASGWSHDDASHWHACLNGCGTQLDKAAHDTNGADGACSVCGYIEGHKHSLTRQQYTDGCANNPVTYYTCSGCSNLFLDENGTQVVTMDDIQKMSAHDLVHHTAVEATCEHAGNIEYWECDNCHKFFKDEGITEVEQSDIVKAQLDHDYEYQSNSTQHWKECTMCKTELDGSRENHSFGAADSQGNQTCSDCGYKINTGALENVEEYGAYEESMYVVMQDDVTADLKVTYNAAGSSSVTAVPSELIRTVNGATRVDIVGVSAGTYDINLSIGGTNFTLGDIEVEAYDRSGYAHFDPDAPNDMYANGIGAYENDGTLKDGALVIYLTEANKNDISDSAYVYDEETDSYTKADITKYFHPNATSKSIGYFLNNRNYTGDEGCLGGGIDNYGVRAACLEYGAVAVRVIGKVSAEVEGDGTKSLIDGLTSWASTGNGGSTDDNGRMARMVNPFNLTIEGIGEDASIYGWGVHFIANNAEYIDKYDVNAGESFEVRNIIFKNYPEDAVGMEGKQEGTSITVPVQRCWIHNNVFYPGYCANDGSSDGDKGEGDGSCDFKRGYWYTFSYNYMEGCHKTNLIGSSDSSLQYNLTFHHNWWNNVVSRQPLTRQANVHYYNNYISGASDYVISARANCYVLAEGNFFYNCKNVIQQKDGTVKFWNNTLLGCYESVPTQVSSRDEVVVNKCKDPTTNTDYSRFETNPDLFYDAEGKLATDSVTARKVVMQKAGVHGFGVDEVTPLNEQTPNQSVSVGENGLTVDLNSISGNYSGGVLFNTGKAKAKGQIATFTLSGEAEIKVEGSGAYGGQLFDAEGNVWIEKIAPSATAVLPAGTYVIYAGHYDKEFNITSLSFADTSASSDARVQAAKDAIGAIPSEITLESADLVTAARNAYNALTASEKQGVDSALLSKLEEAESALGTAQVENVENLISQIGDVTADSYEKISAARAAYNALSPELQGDVNNYSTLTAAEEKFKGYAVKNVNKLIEALGATEGVTDKDAATALLTEYENAQGAYDALDEEQQKQVVGYSKVSNGIAYLEGVLNVYDFKDALAAVDVDSADMATLGAIVGAYNGLDKTIAANLLTSEENIKYELVVAKSEELASQTTVISFGDEETSYTNQSGVIAVTGNTSSDSKYGTVTYNGVVYSTCLKIESSTSVQITAGSARTLLLYSNGTTGNTIKIDGEKVECDAKGVFKVQINGSCTITKGDSLEVFVIVLAAPEA
ncbi:MAG TPA: Ig-like domain-containing protein [Candidatus Coproplasma stercorigallinarum]|nr:Ig-like domain-containing protein [Candidatus Coproplasma stercorigallinarum]